MVKTIAILATVLCMANVYADQFAPGQPAREGSGMVRFHKEYPQRYFDVGTVSLGDHTAVVYYTEHGDEYEVVTTIGPNLGTDGSIVRHVAHVRAGESFEIEFGSTGSGSALRTIAVSRSGDALMVSSEDPPSVAQND